MLGIMNAVAALLGRRQDPDARLHGELADIKGIFHDGKLALEGYIERARERSRAHDAAIAAAQALKAEHEGAIAGAETLAHNLEVLTTERL